MRLLNRVSIKNIFTFILMLSFSACSQTTPPISLDAGSSAPGPDSDAERILSFSKDPTVLKYFGSQDAVAYGNFLKSIFDPSATNYYQLMALSSADTSTPANGNYCRGIDGNEYPAGMVEAGVKQLTVGMIEYEIVQKIDCEKKCYIFSYKDRLVRKLSTKTVIFMEHAEENIDLKTCLDCPSVYDQTKKLIDGKIMQNISEKVESEYCYDSKNAVVRILRTAESTQYNSKTTGHPLGCLSTPEFSTDPVTEYDPPKLAGETLVKYQDRMDDLYEAAWIRLKCKRDLAASDYNPVRP